MSQRINKISTQVGITSATVLMSLAIGTSVSHQTVLAAQRANDQSALATPNQQTKTITRTVKVLDPEEKKPIIYRQTVTLVKHDQNWQAVGDNYWAPLFIKQYEEYEPDQLYIPAKLINEHQSSETVTIKYHEVKIPDRYRLMNETVSVWTSPDGKMKLSDTRGKIGEWVDFPTAPAGYQFGAEHPERIHLISPQPIQFSRFPVMAIDAQGDPESKDLTRSVTFKLPSGDQTVIQKAKAERARISMADHSGMAHWTPWKIVESAEVAVPQVAGYVSSLAQIPAMQLINEDPDQPLPPLMVTYQPNASDENKQPADQESDKSSQTDQPAKEEDQQQSVDTDSEGQPESQPSGKPSESDDDDRKSSDHSNDDLANKDDGVKETEDHPAVDDGNSDDHNADSIKDDHQPVQPVKPVEKVPTDLPKKDDFQHRDESSGSGTDSSMNVKDDETKTDLQQPDHQQSVKKDDSLSKQEINHDDHEQKKLTPQPTTKGNDQSEMNGQRSSQSNRTSEEGKPIVNDDVNLGEMQAALNQDHDRLHQLDSPGGNSDDEHAKLPQTGNRATTMTSLVGMAMSLLAGLLSGIFLKGYYRRQIKHHDHH